jgi:hypothetical protein
MRHGRAVPLDLAARALPVGRGHLLVGVAGGERKAKSSTGRMPLMRPNGRPVLAVSELAPNLLMLCPGARPVLACPDCGTWRVPSRGMLPAHRAADGITRCPGSGQRVRIDLTAAEWRARLDAAVREAGLRRGSRVHCGARPPVAPPVFRIARAA